MGVRSRGDNTSKRREGSDKGYSDGGGIRGKVSEV